MKNLNSLVSALSISIVAACSSTYSVPINTPNGDAGTAIECTSMVDCLKGAGTACPKGYDKVDLTTYAQDEPDPLSLAAATICHARKAQDPNIQCSTEVTMRKVTKQIFVIKCKGTAAEEAAAAHEAELIEEAKHPPVKCTLGNKEIRREYELNVTKSCNVDEDIAVKHVVRGQDTLFPPAQDSAQCKIDKDQMISDCLRSVQWTYTRLDGVSIIYTLMLEQNFRGAKGNMSTIVYKNGVPTDENIICEGEYSIKEVIK
jgi:hypothetical protein